MAANRRVVALGGGLVVLVAAVVALVALRESGGPQSVDGGDTGGCVELPTSFVEKQLGTRVEVDPDWAEPGCRFVEPRSGSPVVILQLATDETEASVAALAKGGTPLSVRGADAAAVAPGALPGMYRAAVVAPSVSFTLDVVATSTSERSPAMTVLAEEVIRRAGRGASERGATDTVEPLTSTTVDPTGEREASALPLCQRISAQELGDMLGGKLTTNDALGPGSCQVSSVEGATTAVVTLAIAGTATRDDLDRASITTTGPDGAPIVWAASPVDVGDGARYLASGTGPSDPGNLFVLSGGDLYNISASGPGGKELAIAVARVLVTAG